MTIRYSPKQVSDATGVSLAGIRNYTDRYVQNFTPEATPAPGMPRWFTEEDIKLVAFIASKTKQGYTHEQVKRAIEAGELVAFTEWHVEESPTDVPQTPQEEDIGVLVPLAHVKAMQALLQDAQRREQSSWKKIGCYKSRPEDLSVNWDRRKVRLLRQRK